MDHWSKDEILEYIYFDEEKSVYDARDYCQENNMKLAQEYFHHKFKIIINLTLIDKFLGNFWNRFTGKLIQTKCYIM